MVCHRRKLRSSSKRRNPRGWQLAQRGINRPTPVSVHPSTPSPYYSLSYTPTAVSRHPARVHSRGQRMELKNKLLKTLCPSCLFAFFRSMCTPYRAIATSSSSKSSPQTNINFWAHKRTQLANFFFYQNLISENYNFGKIRENEGISPFVLTYCISQVRIEK